ncbi:hypothetical protein B0H16DRAFT_1779134 [Mycena metata]|uniref:Uncharacterized protein n=1 Tax=Mycena metata TaxID=1033252 RepID=A0AAD7JPY3_9AGAR|nr:hypothetical protein B0H16DRAFT_1779134 [Mycena metata]
MATSQQEFLRHVCACGAPTLTASRWSPDWLEGHFGATPPYVSKLLAPSRRGALPSRQPIESCYARLDACYLSLVPLIGPRIDLLGDSRAEASPRLPIFGQPSSALGGMRPFTFVPPLPPPLPSQPVCQPLADEIPIESDGRATSLAAELRASSLVDREGSRAPTRRSPASVKEEEGDPGRTTPFTDRRTWDVDGESLEDMDLTDNAAPS